MAIDPELQGVVQEIFERIVRDRTLSFPWYQPWVRSAGHAEENADLLPLVYSWDEVVTDGILRSFNVSVNSSRMAELLAQRLSRGDPAFRETLGLLTNLLAKAQNNTVVGICRQFGLTPSQLSAKLQQ